MSTTDISPLVRVPVLSNITVDTSLHSSKGSPPRIKIPRRAPRPVPTITAVGVAKPKAHGHAMTKADMANNNGNVQSLKPCS
mmetsp:Transcript_7954/g.17252  ORF Transcript_7954/g.17252 Transcript_7954/m.17252 type:complete len:82 (+) Transcript_7954:2460-2705(+)